MILQNIVQRCLKCSNLRVSHRYVLRPRVHQQQTRFLQQNLITRSTGYHEVRHKTTLSNPRLPETIPTPSVIRHAPLSQSILRGTLFFTLAGFLLFHFANTLLPPTEGPSMLPTIPIYSRVLLNPFVTLSSLRVGDVVAFFHPLKPGERAIKRVIGLPGDFVQVRQVIEDENGRAVSEAAAVRVPQGHVWVEGDNRDASFDSRHYGAISLALVIGRVVRVVIPDGMGWRIDGVGGLEDVEEEIDG